VVLVVNDAGSIINYPVTWDGTNFSFASKVGSTLDALVEQIRVEQIRSKRSSDTFTLTSPASPEFGQRFDHAAWTKSLDV
jgi:hypothetical protein